MGIRQAQVGETGCNEYEIGYCASITEFYANGTEKFLADEPIQLEGCTGLHPVRSAGRSDKHPRCAVTRQNRLPVSGLLYSIPTSR